MNSSHPSWGSVTENLRKIRAARGWTLSDVERKSHGRWKAVVIGSYERADRSLSIAKAIELADFYGVPLAYLLGIESSTSLSNSFDQESPTRLMVDLRKISRSKQSEKLALFTAWITAQRQDWNGEVLTIRASDLSTLALLLNLSLIEARRYLASYLCS